MGSKEGYENLLSYQEVNGEEIKTNLTFNNHKNNMKYSIIILDNDKQINEESLFILAEKRGMVKLELPIKLRKNINVHNLIVLLIPEPFSEPDHPLDNVKALNKITLMN